MKVRREYLRDGKPVTVTAERLGDDLWRVQIGQNTIEVTAQAIAGGVKLTENGAVPARSVTAYGAACDNDYMVRVDGRTCVLSTPRESGRGRGGGGDGTIRAPMTGTVLEVLCDDGDCVTADQTLVVLSAWLMRSKAATLACV